MAQVPYDTGVSAEPFPTVAPRESAPDDYQHIQANPNAFGAEIAQGAQKLGQGATVAAKFFGEAAADNAANEYQERATKLLYGDSSKTTMGPDGKPQQDTGYFGLKGRAALDQRPAVEAQLDSTLKDIRANLQTPEQELQFDNFSRRYRALVGGDIGRHADQQANTWYDTVNKTTAQQQKDLISANADNPEVVAHATSDLINAKVKQAELQGGGDELRSAAIAEGKQEAAIAQITAIAVKDPARAQRMADNYRGILGSAYDAVANHVRDRANLQNGLTLQRQAVSDSYGNLPPAAPGSVTLPQLSNAIEGQESGHNDNVATSSTGAVGPRQIEPVTFRQFAKPGENITNAADNKAVGDRILANYYQQYNGDPYRVAVAYYSGPGNVAPPGSPTPWINNISKDRNGNPIKPVSSYVSDVASRLGVAPGSPFAAEASAERQIMMSDASPEVKQHALAENQRFFREAQIATEADAKGRKDANDAAMNTYVSGMIKNGTATPAMMDQIAGDNKLTGETKENLYRLATQNFGYESTAQFGDAYSELYRRILLPSGDPQRINDANEILVAGSPGGGLRPQGVDRLLKVMGESRKDPDQMSVNQTKSSLIQYAKSKLSFDQEMLAPGLKPLADPKGAQIFDAQFVPKFEAAYDAWTKAGKNPWEFLTQENIDKLMTGLRPKNQMAMDRIAAQGDVTGQPDAQQTIPAPPQGIEAAPWQEVITNRPLAPSGRPVAPQNWANAVTLLRANPTPENIAYFNKAFGETADAEGILKKLGGTEKPAEAKPAGPVVEPVGGGTVEVGSREGAPPSPHWLPERFYPPEQRPVQ